MLLEVVKNSKAKKSAGFDELMGHMIDMDIQRVVVGNAQTGEYLDRHPVVEPPDHDAVGNNFYLSILLLGIEDGPITSTPGKNY